MKSIPLGYLCVIALLYFHGPALSRAQDVSVEPDWCSLQDAERAPRAALQWNNEQLGDILVLGKPDVVQCYKIRLPVDADGHHEVTRLTFSAGQTTVYKAAVYDCPADSWVIRELPQDGNSCAQQTSALQAVCDRWFVSIPTPLANSSATSCTPPGLAYMHLNPETSQKRVLVLQVHYTPDPATYNTALNIPGPALSIGSQPIPTTTTTSSSCSSSRGGGSDILGTFTAASITPPSSLTKALQGLTLPLNQPNVTRGFQCGKRCTYHPMRTFSKPAAQTVNLAALEMHTHGRGVRGELRIVRGWPAIQAGEGAVLTRQLQLKGQQGFGVMREMLDVRDQNLKIYPGDEVHWSCSYDTTTSSSSSSGSEAGVMQGSHASATGEQCQLQMYYWPALPSMRGCSAVSWEHEDPGADMCAYEAEELVWEEGQDRQVIPLRSVFDSKTFPFSRWKTGWKATWVVIYCLVMLGLMCSIKALLSSCKALGWVHRRFKALAFAQQRNVCLYIAHLILDTTVAVIVWRVALEALFGFNEAGSETGTGHLSLFVYLTSFYLLELTWRHSVDTMLILHHVGTIVIITVFGGQLTHITYRFGNPLVIMAIFAVLEHPTYLALLLKRMMPASNPWVPRSMKFAVYMWFFEKISSVGFATWAMYRDWRVMPIWARVAFVVTWVLATAVQLWSGMVQWGIYKQCLYNYKQTLKLNLTKKELLQVLEKEEVQHRRDALYMDAGVVRSGSGSGSRSPGSSTDMAAGDGGSDVSCDGVVNVADGGDGLVNRSARITLMHRSDSNMF